MTRSEPGTSRSPGRERSLIDDVPGMLLGYVAWTQIIPAVLAWLFALFFLAALMLVGMDARGENPADAMLAFSERFPGLSERIGEWFEKSVAPGLQAATDPDSGAVHLDELDWYGFAIRVWLVLSLAGWVVALVVGFIRGPRPPWGLRSKFLVAAAACAVLVVSCIAVMALGVPSIEGSFLEWLVQFSGLGLVVFLFTAWAIAWSHGLGVLSQRL